MVLLITSLFCWIVDPNGHHDFTTIQEAIDDPNVQNYDYIWVYTGTYGPIDYGNKILHILAYPGASPVIYHSTYSPIVDMGTANSSELKGFEIHGSSSATGIDLYDIDHIDIEDCEIHDLNKGIKALDTNQLEIKGCEFYDNTEGLKIEKNVTTSFINHLYSSNFHDNFTAVYTDWSYSLDINSSLFESNEYAFDMCSNHYNTVHLTRVTVTNNDNGFFGNSLSDFDLTSSIVYDNTTNFSGTPYDLDCDYSDIEGDFVGGTGNIDDDPYFCSEYPFEYWLMEGSPCIDTGDPSMQGGDVRIDMGCFETTYDIKECEGQSWNWVSYPRLNREDDEGVNAADTLDEFLDWPFHLEMLFDLLVWSTPTLEYETGTWTPTSYNVYSSKGYKLDPDDTGDHYLPTVSDATRLAADWELEYTLEEGDDCWLGYWLPYTQNIEDAFGEFWEDVHSVSSED